MAFAETLAAATADLDAAIAAMPFNAELAAGTLPAETFRFYIVQDAHYLEGFGRALAQAAARAPDAVTLGQLAGSAKGAVAVEAQLHAEFMALYGVTPEVFAATPRSRACDHYVSYLLATAATAPFPCAVAALLPCFHVYHWVGRQIDAAAAPDNPYRAWIDTYASDDFARSVRAMQDLVARLAEAGDADTREAIIAHVRRATWHEWAFWDSAWRRAGWPDAA